MPDRHANWEQIRRVGLVGGMSWRSTALYYERLNRALEARLGQHHSFKGHVWNLDYADLLTMASVGDWPGVEKNLVDAANGLFRTGCEVVALTAVTAHRWHEAVSSAGPYHVPHVFDAAAEKLDYLRIMKAGILGTAVTCGSDFVHQWLGGGGRDLLFLDAREQIQIDALIQTVLTASDDRAAGRGMLRDAIRSLQSRGAEVVVLACTELPLLLPIPDVDLPLIDCVALHVDEICNSILSNIHVR